MLDVEVELLDSDRHHHSNSWWANPMHWKAIEMQKCILAGSPYPVPPLVSLLIEA